MTVIYKLNKIYKNINILFCLYHLQKKVLIIEIILVYFFIVNIIKIDLIFYKTLINIYFSNRHLKYIY